MSTTNNTRTVVYKPCKSHRFMKRGSRELERECWSCAWAGMRATLAANGLKFTQPTCKAPFPRAIAYDTSRNFTANESTTHMMPDDAKLALWTVNAAAWLREVQAVA